jgi:hypothetical protein
MAKAQHGVVDLSEFKKEQEAQVEEVPSFPDLGPEEQEALAKLAEEHPEDAPDSGLDVVTAFIVYITKEGQVIGTPDINVKLNPERPPTNDDFFSGASVVVKDIQAITTAEQTVALQSRLAQQMAHMQQQQQLAAQQEAQIRAKIASKGGHLR